MKRVLIAFLSIFLIAAILIFRPVPIVAEHKLIAETGIVSDIYEGGENDVVFRMKNIERKFYINRGLESGLEINSLKEKLLGNIIIVKYPKYWTPLDWNNKIKHISKVQFQNEVIFSEVNN